MHPASVISYLLAVFVELQSPIVLPLYALTVYVYVVPALAVLSV